MGFIIIYPNNTYCFKLWFYMLLCYNHIYNNRYHRLVMNLKIGIVGLPNVGKSTLFNALTNAGALAANYPFATIEPNIGIVPVPDERLDILAKM